MKQSQIILIVVLSFGVSSCFDSKRQTQNNVYRPEFDISRDNRNIVCSFYENNKAVIYDVDVTTNKRSRVTPKSNLSFIRPVFSPENNQIACIAESLTDEMKSKIVLVDVATHTLTELTKDSLLILECAFSPNGESIYFVAAKHFGNFSPVARKAPHEMDIYKVDIDSKKVSQITNFNSYYLHGLSVNNAGDSLVFHLMGRENEGLFIMSVDNRNLVPIRASNDLRAKENVSPYQYHSPVLSRDDSEIAFQEPYELYIMDRRTKISKRIFRNDSYPVNVGEARFFYNYNYLMLTLPTNSKRENSKGDNFGFYTLDPETNELKALDL